VHIVVGVYIRIYVLRRYILYMHVYMYYMYIYICCGAREIDEIDAIQLESHLHVLILTFLRKDNYRRWFGATIIHCCVQQVATGRHR